MFVAGGHCYARLPLYPEQDSVGYFVGLFRDLAKAPNHRSFKVTLRTGPAIDVGV
jgi:hypothetical protein